MHIKVLRHTIKNEATIGDLLVDNAFFCHTLEDIVRPDPDDYTPANEAKVWGATAIPAGEYNIVVNYSPKFKKLLPRLLDVPGFDGILIHRGNKPEDTHGCILVGDKIDESGRIAPGTSSTAFTRLMGAITEARVKGEPLKITITEHFDKEP